MNDGLQIGKIFELEEIRITHRTEDSESGHKLLEGLMSNRYKSLNVNTLSPSNSISENLSQENNHGISP